MAAVRGLSLEVAPGEIVGLIGPNGAGKSSTLHAIMGLVRPSAGDVRLGGRSLRGRPPEAVARSGIALVPEGRRIFGELTVDENLRLGLAGRRSPRRRGRGRRRACSRCSRSSPSSAARQAGALSGGQQQQLAIARALVAAPDVLLLDEPSLGLSPTVTDAVFEALAAIRDRGIAVLLVEQRAQRTVALANRTLVLANGEVRLTLTPDDAGDTEPDDPRLPLMTTVLASGLTDFLRAAIEPQVQVDAIGIGAVYALMAVGIGLVFGVLRLINFAYGQLVMAGAFALAFASDRDWPVWVGIVLCFAVVIALSMAMERVVFRPLRTQSAATMLVATFAVAFLLQAIALLIDQRDDTLGEPAASLAKLNLPWTIFGTDVRKITVVAIVTAAVCLVALVLFLGRTNVGLQMRAAAMDFQTARLLGVRANRVIGSAVLALRAPRRDRRGDAHGAAAARHVDLRAPRDDRRARRRRRRRHEPAALGDARRLRDRLRLRAARRRAPDRTRASTCRRSCSGS